MNFSLQEKRLSIHRLRSIFGIKTESAKSLAKFMDQAQAAGDAASTAASNQTDEAVEDPNASTKKNPPETKGKHGHRPASDYTQAKTIDVAHAFLKKGDFCPACKNANLCGIRFGFLAAKKPNRIPDKFPFAQEARRGNFPE